MCSGRDIAVAGCRLGDMCFHFVRDDCLVTETNATGAFLRYLCHPRARNLVVVGMKLASRLSMLLLALESFLRPLLLRVQSLLFLVFPLLFFVFPLLFLVHSLLFLIQALGLLMCLCLRLPLKLFLHPPSKINISPVRV
jgi:hypothetical protein